MSSKLTALTATTTPVSTDLVYVVTDPSGTPASHKCTLGNLFQSTLHLSMGTANILEQRDGANAQTFKLSNTWTDGSNFEQLEIKWAGNSCLIGTHKAGTGAARSIFFGTNIEGDPTASLSIQGAPIVFYSSGSACWQIPTTGHLTAQGAYNVTTTGTVSGTLKTQTNATTGLVAGVLAATTNASITITDGSGQVYRIPCII